MTGFDGHDIHAMTPAQASDPNTPPAVLARIVAERPELRPYVALNPSAYPALLDWLAALGDPVVASVLAARRDQPVTQAVPAPPPPPPPAAVTPSVPVPSAAPTTLAGPAASGQPQSARSSGGRRAILVAVGALVVVGAVGAIAYGMFFSKLGGAASPEAAVQRFLAAAEAKDVVGIYGVLAPDEVQGMREALDALQEIAPEGQGTAAGAGGGTWQAALDGIEIRLDDVTVESSVIDEGLAMVSLTGGSLTIDADADQVTEAFSPYLNVRSESGGYVFGEDAEQHFRDSLADEVPYRTTVSEMLVRTWEGEEIDPFLVTVEIDGAWYVSPLMTWGEYGVQVRGTERGWMPEPDAYAAFDSPEAAAEGLIDGLADYWAYGDPDDAGRVLSSAEHRFLTMYGSGVFGVSDGGSWQINQSDISVREVDGDVALIDVDRVEIEVLAPDDYGYLVEVSGGCVWATDSYYGDRNGGCLGDSAMVRELGLDGPPLVAVRRDGGWSISLLATLFNAATVATENAQRLMDEGVLEDPGRLDELLGAPVTGAADNVI